MVTEFGCNGQNDSVINFMISQNVRGRFARLDNSLNNILGQHKYPEKVCSLIAEAVLLTVMIGQAIKLRWKLSLQIRGNGSIKLIAVDYFSPKDDNTAADIRAYAKFDLATLNNQFGNDFQSLGKGFFAVLIDQGEGTKPYQGITPLTGNSLSSCAETYFSQSEQLPTVFKIISGQSSTKGSSQTWRSGGIMLQQLPDQQMKHETFTDLKLKEKNIFLSEDSDDSENWSHAKIILNTIKELELVGPELAPTTVLKRLFHKDQLSIFHTQNIKFGCSCSIEKVIKTLSIYSSKDIKTMTTDKGNVTADCQFCGQHYVLSPNEIGFEAED